MSKKIIYVNGQMYEYEEYKLVDRYDPILKTKLEPYVFRNEKDARYLAVSMLDTMHRNMGVGLAANQVGLNHRLFVIGAEGVGFAFFNPVILGTEGTDMFDEGCLSFPGLYLPVKRPAVVTIKYTDMNGKDKEQTFAGLSARTILHEYDHLEGIVYTSLVSPIILEREKRKVKSNIKRLHEQYIRLEKQRIIEEATQRVVYEENKKLTGNQGLITLTTNSLNSNGL